jgi:hypothetical protein
MYRQAGGSDARRILATPLWQIADETAARAIAEWKAVEQRDLPQNMCAPIEKIHTVAANVR